MKQVPVYFFTGFLDGGKTTFIQDTLSSSDIDDDKVLLIVCEQGEVEYNPDKFTPPVDVEYITKAEDLTLPNLKKMAKKHNPDSVFVEYNGMWKNQEFFQNMPENWAIAEEMCFMDATTFLMYNQNMRQQTFDKMQTVDMLIFNRCPDDVDQEAFHKEARIANRRSQIIYEYANGKIEPDDIDDPLPFDKESDFIEIEPDCYAEWYHDINENGEEYQGKTVKFKARAALVNELPSGMMAVGRHVMTCCIEDVQFAGLLCMWLGSKTLKTGDWYEVTAEARWEFADVYKEHGPVLYCKSVVACDPVEPEIATF